MLCRVMEVIQCHSSATINVSDAKALMYTNCSLAHDADGFKGVYDGVISEQSCEVNITGLLKMTPFFCYIKAGGFGHVATQHFQDPLGSFTCGRFLIEFRDGKRMQGNAH